MPDHDRMAIGRVWVTSVRTGAPDDVATDAAPRLILVVRRWRNTHGAAGLKKTTDLFSARIPPPKTGKHKSNIFPLLACMAEFSGVIVRVLIALPTYVLLTANFPQRPTRSF